MVMQRPPAPSGVEGVSSSGKAPAEEDAYSRTYPLLFEYLTSTVWGDGSSRESSTLTLFVEEGRWKCCLNDRARQRSAFIAGRGLGGLLADLEEGLQEDDLDWRPHRKRAK